MITPGTMSVLIDGEFKELGIITETRAETLYQEFQCIAQEPFSIPIETTTNYKISLTNPDELKMFKDYKHIFKINGIITKAFVKSWSLNIGIYEHTLRLEIVVLEEAMETPLERPMTLETKTHDEFQEDLV